MHVLQKIAERVQEHYNRTGIWMALAYTFIEPNDFSHPILYSERYRGSGDRVLHHGLFDKTMGPSEQIPGTHMFWGTFAGMHPIFMEIDT